jgi:threonine dehydrogenase-like Zn-dependent dehydrogenase
MRAKALPICGSDKSGFYFEGESRWAGHEGTGEVVETAPNSRFSPGDRVVIAPQATCGECALCHEGDWIYCRQAPPSETHFRELIRKQEGILARLPDDIPFDLGSLAGCALCPAFSALDLMGTSAHDTVLVTGLGPVGLGGVASASYLGARVLAVEPQEFRRGLARELGADEVFDPGDGDPLEWARDLTGRRGPTRSIECSGNSQALRTCIDATAILGRVGIVGENHNRVEIGPSDDFIRKGLTMLGTWFGSWHNYEHIFEMIRRKPEVAKIITHRFPFDQAQQAFETFFSGKAGKVLLIP